MSETTYTKFCFLLFRIGSQNKFQIEIRLSVPFSLLVITQALQVGCDNANSKPGKMLMDWLCKLTFVCSVTSIFYLEIN